MQKDHCHEVRNALLNLAGVIRELWKDKKITDKDRALMLVYIKQIEIGYNSEHSQ